MSRRQRQRGVVLITAILVVALAAIAAAAILTSGSLAIHRTQNLNESELGWWYDDGVESWGRTILERDTQMNKYDSLADIWAMPVDFLPVDQGGLRGGISDLQGRYNLNNLAVSNTESYQEQLTIFTRLYEAATEGDEYQAKALASAIRDYVDADSDPTGTDGGEDAEYLGMDPPRRVPNRPMASPTELLAVKGMTPKVYAKLAPYVCALPQIGTKINVNTASPLLLQSLTSSPGDGLEKFISDRVSDPAESVSELFNDRKVFDAKAVKNSAMSVDSNFFELHVEAYIGSGRVELYSFYYRPGSGHPQVYGRSTFTE
ncbi:type II secretion system minor pseudopilin GspK [Solimonas marina]|uniref:Type II secretion system protein K n=1 Tax=Solimonas marina TaxID=2714601 RepID=A0A969W9C9_9GAMM|nr:type II secretion system minor pseudopilin GspK [Solimonas marina]NKF23141.1 type II secretion system minor pseudopilin GspK [Solimonas marina]